MSARKMTVDQIKAMIEAISLIKGAANQLRTAGASLSVLEGERVFHYPSCPVGYPGEQSLHLLDDVEQFIGSLEAALKKAVES